MVVVCFFKHVLLFLGRQVAIGGVRLLWIIKPLDVHKSGTLQFLLVLKISPAGSFCLPFRTPSCGFGQG